MYLCVFSVIICVYDCVIQVDDFQAEAYDMLAELDSFSPRSHSHSRTHTVGHHAAPSFTRNIQDCEVEEGDSFDLECTTQGNI